MSNLIILLIILAVTLAVGGIVVVLFPYLKKKGIQTEEVLKKADTFLQGFDTITSFADKLLPANPIVNILDIVGKFAKISVSNAEQMYITSQLAKDDRNAKAKDTIYATLKMLNIEVTPELDKIIDSAIESECLALGHKDLTDAEKQTEKELIQAQNQTLTLANTALQAQNDQIKQSVAQLQTIVQ